MRRTRGWEGVAWSLAVLLVVAVGAFFGVRWLHPGPPDASEWFPMRLGDRWTYADKRNGGDVVFEVVRRTEREGLPLYSVERRIKGETIVFTLSVLVDGVWIHESSKGVFDPAFREFKFPPRHKECWEHSGTFGGTKIGYESTVSEVAADEFEVVETSRTSASITTFRLRRGMGVTRLSGKSHDPHAVGLPRYFDWTLKEFRRR